RHAIEVDRPTPIGPRLGVELWTNGDWLSRTRSPRSSTWSGDVSAVDFVRTPRETGSSTARLIGPSGMPSNENRPSSPVVTCTTPGCNVLPGWNVSVTYACAAGVAPSGSATRPRMDADGASCTVIGTSASRVVTAPEPRPDKRLASARTEKAPTGTPSIRTVPSPAVKPTKAPPKGLAGSPGGAAVAVSVTRALGTRVTPSKS